jgi:RNA polymerase sigma-70 factor (ECF subfamily)
MTRKRLKKELSFKSYLFSIAYNDLCKFFRKQRHNQLYLKQLIKENPNLSFEIEEEINNKLLLSKVEQIINNLPEKHRKILCKRRDEGKSSKEIGSEMHLSPGTVDNYLSEAVYIIRGKFKS